MTRFIYEPPIKPWHKMRVAVVCEGENGPSPTDEAIKRSNPHEEHVVWKLVAMTTQIALSVIYVHSPSPQTRLNEKLGNVIGPGGLYLVDAKEEQMFRRV